LLIIILSSYQNVKRLLLLVLPFLFFFTEEWLPCSKINEFCFVSYNSYLFLLKNGYLVTESMNFAFVSYNSPLFIEEWLPCFRINEFCFFNTSPLFTEEWLNYFRINEFCFRFLYFSSFILNIGLPCSRTRRQTAPDRRAFHWGRRTLHQRDRPARHCTPGTPEQKYFTSGRRKGWGVNILEDERNRIALLQ
jgi:hypothetical protein